MQTVQSAVTPERLLSFGLGFWSSKTLLSAVAPGLFTELAKQQLDVAAIAARCSLHERGVRDFLGGLLEMANARLYRCWGSPTGALRTGKVQNEAANSPDAFEALYSDPARLRQFLSAMTGVSFPAARAIAERFPWSLYHTFADIGCAQGALPVQVALSHPGLRGIAFDLAPVEPIFKGYAASFGLNGRMRFAPGNFFRDPLSQADVLMLLAKAHAALSEGGSLIVYEALIDDERRRNPYGLLASLNMLIETAGGFDYTIRARTAPAGCGKLASVTRASSTWRDRNLW